MNVFIPQVQSETFRPEAGLPRLRLPNAKLRKPEPITADLSSLKGYEMLAQRLPKKASLAFDWGEVSIDGSSVTINPNTPGEYAIPIPMCKAGQADILVLQITVNPDPTALMKKEIDPPADAPYQKPSSDKCCYATDQGGHIVCASRRGQGHAIDGSFRDDDFKVETIPEKGFYLFAVADGAGSAIYSRRGSKLATEAAIENLKKSINDSNLDDDADGISAEGAIGPALVAAAKSGFMAIQDEVARKNSNQTELGKAVSVNDYNTTLLLAAVKVNADGGLGIGAFAIGDGAIVWCSDSRSVLLSEPDGGDYAGETYFLTMERLWKTEASDPVAFRKSRVRIFNCDKEDSRHGTLMLMTDGVSDPFFPSHERLRDHSLWREFLNTQIRENAKILRSSPPSPELATQLLEWINFRERGHFDDRTLALFELPDSNKQGEGAHSETPSLNSANAESISEKGDAQ